jgi:DNA-binding GntR family transcriptional regulator
VARQARESNGADASPSAADAPNFQPQVQLSDQVAAYVRELIMSGQVRQGEFLRLEKLAAELGVSATPVREGLLALRGEGFLQLAPRRGFVVAPLRRQDVEDLYFVQAQLAGELAARAAAKMDADDFTRLVAIQEELEELSRGDNVAAIEEVNYRFHRSINLAADSAKLAWFLGRSVRYAPRLFYGAIHGWQQASIEDHRAVVEAFRERSARGAEAAMRAHILHAGQLLVQHLDKGKLWD